MAVMKNPKDIRIDKYFTPFQLNEQPFLVEMPGEKAPFVAVFSTPEKLREQMQILAPGVEYKIKQIDEQREFCESIWEAGVRIMLDPRPDFEANKTRWTEVVSNKGLN